MWTDTQFDWVMNSQCVEPENNLCQVEEGYYYAHILQTVEMHMVPFKVSLILQYLFY